MSGWSTPTGEMAWPCKDPAMKTRTAGFLSLACFIGTIFLANWLISTYGVVSVGFGLLAPAGVYAVGLAFTFRDVAHRVLGPAWVFAAIVAGAGLSASVSPRFALASGVAFLVSETSDLLVYAPLERRSWLGAVALSNTVGLVLDSVVFLWLAFGSLSLLAGQIVGKTWMTLLAIAVLYVVRRGTPHRQVA
jgi:queuosine precursor transporter